MFIRFLLACLLAQVTYSQLDYDERITISDSIADDVDVLLLTDAYGFPNQVVTAGEEDFIWVPGTFSQGYGNPQNLAALLGDENAAIAQEDLNTDGVTDFVVAVDGDYSAQPRPTQAIRLILNRPGPNPGGSPIRRTLLDDSPITSGTRTLTNPVGKDVKICDLDGDGDLDIVATVGGRIAGSNGGFLMIFLNNGQADFVTTVIATDIAYNATLECADFDRNNKADIAVLDVSPASLKIFFQETNGTFTEEVIDSSPEGNFQMAVGNFNTDARLDIAAIGLDRIIIYLGLPNRRLMKFDLGLPLTNQTDDWRDSQITWKDVTGDGLTDLVTAYGSRNAVFYNWQFQPDSISNNQIPLVAADTIRKYAFGDINEDGTDDVVVYAAGDTAAYAFLAKSPTCAEPNESCDATTPCCNAEAYSCKGVCRRKVSDDGKGTVKGGDGKLPADGRVRGSTRRLLKGA